MSYRDTIEEILKPEEPINLFNKIPITALLTLIHDLVLPKGILLEYYGDLLRWV